MLLPKAKFTVAMFLAISATLGATEMAAYQAAPADGQEPAERKAAAPAVVKETPAKKGVRQDLYGDPLPNGAVARLGTVRFRHEGEAAKLAFSGDGKILIGETSSGIIFWDTNSGKELRRLTSEKVRLNSVFDVTPDGNQLALVEFTLDSSVVLNFWDIRKAKKVRTVLLNATKDEILQGEPSSTFKLAPNGKTVALSFGITTAVYDTTNGKRIASFGRGKGVIYALAFSPDNKTLAVGTLEPALQLWEIGTGKLRHGVDGPKRGFVNAVAFSSDGKMLAAGWWDRIALFDPMTAKQLGLLEAKMESINGLAFTPDGKTLVSGSQDGKIRVWAVATSEARLTLRSGMNCGRTMALSSDGTTVAIGTAGNAVQLWNVATGKEIGSQYQGHHSWVTCLAFSSDGKTLASSDYQARLWDTATWKLVRVLEGNTYSLAFTPDSQTLASISSDHMVKIRDMDSKNKSTQINIPNANVTSVLFWATGKKLATLESDPETLRLRHWNATTGRQENLWTIPPGRMTAIMPDGMGVLGTKEKAIHFFDAKLGRDRVFREPGVAEATTLAVSPDGRILVTGDWSESYKANLWEITTGKKIRTVKAHDCMVTCAAWSPDGRFVATCGDYLTYGYSDKGSVQVWDAATGKELARFGGLNTAVANVAFSLDGYFVAGALRDSTILVWDVRQATRASAHFAEHLEPKDMRACWADLLLEDVPKAHAAIWKLIFAQAQAAAFLREKMRPTPLINAAGIRKWIAELDSDKFSSRQAAAKQLEAVGGQVQPHIQKALKAGISLETRRRLEKIMNRLADAPSPETLRTIRAIMVLERIGTLEAQAVLQTLASGAPGARETEEAKDSVHRLTARTATRPH